MTLSERLAQRRCQTCGGSYHDLSETRLIHYRHTWPDGESFESTDTGVDIEHLRNALLAQLIDPEGHTIEAI